MKKAMLSESLEQRQLRCRLCAHACRLKPDQTGICGVRQNIEGELYTLTYDRVAALHTDPIEKKPLYHFLPGSPSFSLGTMGCNFSCSFCQNHTLSCIETPEQITGESIPPRRLVAMAERAGCRSIAYTYSEPTIFFELMLDTARIARDAGLKNVMVTNGYMSATALEALQPYLDGANVDLKAFTDEFYRTQCGARLQPVLDTIERMKAAGIWIEVTTLLIPGLNTDEEALGNLIEFIRGIDPEIPWHVSRFFPTHRLTDRPATPEDMIFHALSLGRTAGLKYVYGGNLSSTGWSHTDCPACGQRLIQRNGYSTRIIGLENGRCAHCSAPLAGIWD